MPAGFSTGATVTGEADTRERVDRLVRALQTDAGASVRGIVLYGSHLSRANPDRRSAVDLLVVVDSYRAFYRALADSGELRRWRKLMWWLSQALPPNVIAYSPERVSPTLAKCLIISLAHFRRAMAPRPRDHFVLCRMIQWVELVWAATQQDRRTISSLIAEARFRSVDWVAPYLTGPVDEIGYVGCLMDVCYRGEVRPEKSGRAAVLVDAQAAFLRRAYLPVLERATAEGRFDRRDGFYSLVRPVATGVARRWALYFAVSRLRACARWLKHVVTFDNWLTYLVHKAERHSGQPIALTRLEREWPIVFIWPRAIAFLRIQARSGRHRGMRRTRSAERLGT